MDKLAGTNGDGSLFAPIPRSLELRKLSAVSGHHAQASALG